MKQNIAFLLGASGSVGAQILDILLNHPAYQKVVVFGRKTMDESKLATQNKLVQKLVPEMTPSALAKAVAETLAIAGQETEIVAFSALGVGAGTAKLTIEQHRAVDVELNRAFAQAVRDSAQVKYFGLLSAIGSDPNAKTTGSGAAGMPRYARVKGEAEEAVKQHGPKALGIFRPAMIRGSQHTPKSLELLAPIADLVIPKKWHSITTREIAQAMVAASLNPQAAQGTFHYPEMIELIRAQR